MPSITVNLSRQGRHWGVQFAINGKIEPRTVLGCSDGLSPIVTALIAAESEIHAILTRTEGDVVGTPTTITVGMPSGRVLTFKLSSMQQTFPE